MSNTLLKRVSSSADRGSKLGDQLIAAWSRMPIVDEAKAHFFVRYVVVDVETSGLQLGMDRVTKIGALGVHHGSFSADDACLLALHANDPDQAASELVAFLEFVGNSPVVTYRAAFVDSFLKQATRELLGIEFVPDWIDLAWVLPEFFGSLGDENATLDDWLGAFGLEVPGRTHALPDAFACARLLLAVLARAAQERIDTPAKLRGIEANRRWLGR